jgi:hypothetical protein
MLVSCADPNSGDPITWSFTAPLAEQREILLIVLIAEKRLHTAVAPLDVPGIKTKKASPGSD